MANSYQKGYKRGYQDACAGKSKVNSAHFINGVMNAINPFGNIDEFVKGYEEGYRIGSRDKEQGKCK